MRWAEDRAKTASHEHYREICAECRTVISQCRCRSASKVEKLGLCDSCDPESAEKQATLYQQAVDEAVWGVVAVKRKPSFPNLVDEYEPTDPALWERVLEVASGDRRDYTQGDRTINSPNDGRGYQGMPSNPKGIAWAVKQYKGFDGNFRKQAKVAADSKYDHIDFKPPKSVADAAKKGLEYRKNQGKDKAGLTPSEASKEGIGSGVQRASNLKNRDALSPKVINQMVAFFSRHEKNKSIKAEHKDEPWKDKGYVSWLLWGGDPGKAWAEKVQKQMEAADRAKEASWEARLARMKAGGIEVTHGPDPEAQKLASEGKIRLAGSDGLRWYWDLAYPDRQVQAGAETKEAEVSGVCENGPAARWAD